MRQAEDLRRIQGRWLGLSIEMESSLAESLDLLPQNRPSGVRSAAMGKRNAFDEVRGNAGLVVTP